MTGSAQGQPISFGASGCGSQAATSPMTAVLQREAKMLSLGSPIISANFQCIEVFVLKVKTYRLKKKKKNQEVWIRNQEVRMVISEDVVLASRKFTYFYTEFGSCFRYFIELRFWEMLKECGEGSVIFLSAVALCYGILENDLRMIPLYRGGGPTTKKAK